jgi:predicted secreted protein
MPASIGRTAILSWNSSNTAILGIREKSFALAGEPIDVTSDEDDGWRQLLTVPSQQQIDVSVSGVTKDDTLRTAWFSGDYVANVIFYLSDNSTISGTFFLASYTETMPYNEAITFEATLQSTGTVIYTPGA